eukprot:gene8237-9084_t
MSSEDKSVDKDGSLSRKSSFRRDSKENIAEEVQSEAKSTGSGKGSSTAANTEATPKPWQRKVIKKSEGNESGSDAEVLVVERRPSRGGGSNSGGETPPEGSGGSNKAEGGVAPKPWQRKSVKKSGGNESGSVDDVLVVDKKPPAGKDGSSAVQSAEAGDSTEGTSRKQQLEGDVSKPWQRKVVKKSEGNESGSDAEVLVVERRPSRGGGSNSGGETPPGGSNKAEGGVAPKPWQRKSVKKSGGNESGSADDVLVVDKKPLGGDTVPTSAESTSNKQQEGIAAKPWQRKSFQKSVPSDQTESNVEIAVATKTVPVEGEAQQDSAVTSERVPSTTSFQQAKAQDVPKQHFESGVAKSSGKEDAHIATRDNEEDKGKREMDRDSTRSAASGQQNLDGPSSKTTDSTKGAGRKDEPSASSFAATVPSASDIHDQPSSTIPKDEGSPSSNKLEANTKEAVAPSLKNDEEKEKSQKEPTPSQKEKKSILSKAGDLLNPFFGSSKKNKADVDSPQSQAQAPAAAPAQPSDSPSSGIETPRGTHQQQGVSHEVQDNTGEKTPQLSLTTPGQIPPTRDTQLASSASATARNEQQESLKDKKEDNVDNSGGKKVDKAKKEKKQKWPWSFFRKGRGPPPADSRGQPYIPLTPEVSALKIQSAWRGKFARKMLWRKHLAAIDIQRIFRGKKEQTTFSRQLSKFRLKQQERKESSDRMRRIRNREKDLNLLKRMGSEHFTKFEALQRNSNAKVIQRAWRRRSGHEERAFSSQHTRRSGARITALGQKGIEMQKAIRRSREVEQEEAKEQRERSKLFSFVKNSLTRQQSSSEEKILHSKPDFSHPDHTLGLTYLHQRIRDQALQRIDNENKNSGIEAGVRRQYQALVFAQQKVQDLLYDYQQDKDYMADDQAVRYKLLNSCTSRLSNLSQPPSLQTMAAAINHSPSSSEQLNPDQKAARDWMVQEHYQLDEKRSNVGSDVDRLERAIQRHLIAKKAVLDSSKWSAVYLPRFDQDNGSNREQNKGQPAAPQSHFLATANGASSFRHLAGDWANDLDGDESLQWVTYACQPSNVLSNAPELQQHLATSSSSSSQPMKDRFELLRGIYSASQSSNQRKQRIETQCNLVKAEQDDLAKAIYEEYCHGARGRLRLHGLTKKDKENRKISLEELRLRAIVKVQSCARRWLTTRRIAEMKRQRRVMTALQHLLQELSGPNGLHNPRQGRHGGDYYSGGILEQMAGQVMPRIMTPALPSIPASHKRSEMTVSRGDSTFKASLSPFSPSPPTPHLAEPKTSSRPVIPPLSSLSSAVGRDIMAKMEAKRQPPTPFANGAIAQNDSIFARNRPMAKEGWTLDAVAQPLNKQNSAHNQNLLHGARLTPGSSLNTPSTANTSAGGGGNGLTDHFHRLVAPNDVIAGSMIKSSVMAQSSQLPPTSSTKSTATTAAVASKGSTKKTPSTPLLDLSQVKGGLMISTESLSSRSSRDGGSGSAQSSARVPVPPSALHQPSHLSSAFNRGDRVRFAPQVAGEHDSVQLQEPIGYRNVSMANTPVAAEKVGPSGANVGHSPVHPSTRYSPMRALPPGSGNRGGSGGGGVEDSINDSVLLSPFLELPHQEGEDDVLDYISTPSQSHGSHSLSRSLTASFGLVEGAAGHPHESSLMRSTLPDFTGSGRIDRHYPAPNERSIDVLVEVEKRFKSQRCHMLTLVNSALQADITNFRKSAAYEALTWLLEIVGTKPLLSWLQRFALNKPLDSTLSVEALELDIQSAALLLCELVMIFQTTTTGSRGGEDDRELSEDEVHGLIQLTMLVSLLSVGSGASEGGGSSGSDSSGMPVVRLSALAGICEDLWIQRLPTDQFDTFLILSKVRAYIVRKASKAATNPQEVCSSMINIVANQERALGLTIPDPTSSLTIKTLATVLLKLCPDHVFIVTQDGPSVSNSREMASISPEAAADGAQRVARLLVSYSSWEDQAMEANTKAILAMLCCLPSFRNLQKRLQVWFRLVPSMLSSMLAPFPTGSASATEFTIKLASQSEAPLTLAETRLLAHLLVHRTASKSAGSGRGSWSNNTSLESQVDDETALLDVVLLKRIQGGDFIQAAL